MTDVKDSEPTAEAMPIPELWPTAAPPEGFIERVMAARAEEIGARVLRSPSRRRRRVIVVTVAMAAAAIVIVGARWQLLRSWAPAQGVLEVAARTTVDMGRRARAVLEPGVRLSYEVAGSGAALVRQDRGAVFYRVEPGGPFRVATPAGEIDVVGTCFRVSAGGPAGTVISVLEGAVQVRNRRGALALAAGETAVLARDEADAPHLIATSETDPDPGVVSPQPAPTSPPAPEPTRHEDVSPGHLVRGGRGKKTGDTARVHDAQSVDHVDPGWAPAPPPWPAPKAQPLPANGGPVIRLRFDERGAAAAVADDAASIEEAPPALTDYGRQLRERIAAAWRPLTAIREEVMLEDVGVGAGRRALLRVRIDRSGRVLRSDVDEPSGLPAFDREAVRALQIAQLPAPPVDLLDDFGELGLRFELHLDLAVSAFLARVRRDVAERWHPALAFQRFARPEQITVVRVLIAPAGVIAQSRVDLSSGIHHLDDSALAATRPGTRVPVPPAALCPAGAPLSLRLEFVPDVSGHGTVRVTREAASAR